MLPSLQAWGFETLTLKCSNPHHVAGDSREIPSIIAFYRLQHGGALLVHAFEEGFKELCEGISNRGSLRSPMIMRAVMSPSSCALSCEESMQPRPGRLKRSAPKRGGPHPTHCTRAAHHTCAKHPCPCSYQCQRWHRS